MHYSESEPCAPLRPFIRCLWHLRSDAPSVEPERIVPDGCGEIILNRAECFRRLATSGDFHEQARVLLVGQLRRSIWIVPTGAIDLLGIRFEPGGLFALTGIPMHEVTDVDLCVGQFDPALRDRLAGANECSTILERVRAVESVLLWEFTSRQARVGLTALAVRQIARGAGTAEDVSRSMGVHRRTLERMFRMEVGLSPKQLIRIRRVQSVLRHVDESIQLPSWATVAAAHGYADQSHLIREFHTLVGTTPARYLASRSELSMHFEN